MAFAVQQMRLAPALRSISKPLNVLWEESISVASICQVIARRTSVNPDEAFLTGLLHGIGRLYIMVRAVGLQGDGDHSGRSDADLTDVLIAGVALTAVLREPGPRTVDMDGIQSFRRLALTPQDCADILKHAEYQLGSLHATLGC